jgi:hypothetical protein
MTALSILLLLFSFSSIINAHWFRQNPLPQGNWLFDVKYADQQIAWAVGAD